MNEDFNPETLLSDIDKIMEQQGYPSISPAGEPIEVKAAAPASIPTPAQAPPEEMMNRIDRVIHPEQAPAGPAVNPMNAGAIPRTTPEPVPTVPPKRTVHTTQSIPQGHPLQPDRFVMPDAQPEKETVMPPDTEAAPMFTTIDEPIEWVPENRTASTQTKSDTSVSDDFQEPPPVSYLEGASANGYSVENVAFGDISVGVETESVEFSVGHPLLRLLRNILICVAAALLLSLLVTKFVAHHTTVDGSSMMSTLNDGDQLIVQQLSYYFHDPERFDIVVFPISREDNYIKRVIGLPGETVQIIDGQVYINGNLLTEDRYGIERIQDPGNAADTIYLQADEYFVLGDNRNASVDSRFSEVGVIKRKDIKAKAWLRFYPFGSFGFVS